MRQHTYLSLVLLCILFWGARSIAMAQSEAESASGALILQSPKSSFEHTIPTGSKLAVKYTVDARIFRDLTLDGVLENAVILSGDTVGLDYLDRVVLRDERRFQTGKKLLIASIIITAAFYLSFIGLFALGFSGSPAYIVLLALVILLGIPASAAMPGGIITGIVLMAIAGRHYRLWREWTPRTRIDK
jgi:hypothetical protein